MSYSSLSTINMFDSLLPYYPRWTPAEVWVKAENVMELRAIISKWAQRIRDETAENYLPGMGCYVLPDFAAKMLADLEDEMDHEVNTRPSLQCDDGPGFDTLSPSVQCNMVDEILAAHKPYLFIKAEAQRRLSEGEQLPKDGAVDPEVFQHGYEEPPAINLYED